VSKSAYEIVIVDDGSSDETGEMVRGLIASSPVRITYLRHKTNRGPAATRNLGIKTSQGELILFMGDDAIATPNLLREHLKWHQENPENEVAILGHATWAKDMNITPLLEYLETGPQFAYPFIPDPNNVSFRYFYTINLSMKRNFLCTYGYFDEDFKLAMWEDIELGYRLSKYGLRLMYDKNAIAHHYHPTDLQQFLKRQYNVGRYAVLFLSKHQEIGWSLPQVVNPLLMLSQDQTDRLIKYLEEVENHIIAKKSSYDSKDCLFFLYGLLDSATKAKGFLDELNSRELVKNRNLELFAKAEKSMERLMALPVKPPDILVFLINEYNNQILKKAEEKERQLEEKERQLEEKKRQLEVFRNSWSWKITRPLRKIHAIIFSKRLKNE
jgi:GT2 family glycosyltransferase